MKAEVRIRLAAAGDADSIAELMREAFAEFESLYTAQAFAATTPNAEKIRERFAEKGAIWVALKNEKIVGTVSAVAEGERLYIRSMAVSPSARGLGIGRKLLAEIENFAFENELKDLFLYTTPFLHGAIRLYEQNGFERGEDVEGFFGTRLFAMRKDLRK